MKGPGPKCLTQLQIYNRLGKESKIHCHSATHIALSKYKLMPQKVGLPKNKHILLNQY